jgi:hypothetical protein
MAKRNATAEEPLARAESNGCKGGERGHTPSPGAPCQYLAGGVDSPRPLPAREAEMCPSAVHCFAVLSTGPGTPSHGMIDFTFDVGKGCSESNEADY